MAEMTGKVAVVTGGASGIGERTVRLFAEEGARIVIADMQRERGEALAAELGDAACFELVPDSAVFSDRSSPFQSMSST
jgi:3alpha(or 20beta)-hydroxysteroid dehydrogenase